MTIKEDDLWVNLSPHERDRIATEDLGKTELGRDMLAQDYILKQLTASLMYPEKELGKTFWNKVYALAKEKFGVTDIPVDTFNKVWIVADKAKVLERGNLAYIVGAHLRVMLEEDYVAAQYRVERGGGEVPDPGNPAVAANAGAVPEPPDLRMQQIIREIIIPEIEKEVNQGQNFAPLRQMFYSMILATWYKVALKDALLNQVYSNKAKTSGVLSDDPDVKNKIYEQYLESFRKGAYNYIKEEYDASRQEVVPRKYFSGGLDIGISKVLDTAMTATDKEIADIKDDKIAGVTVNVASIGNGNPVYVSEQIITNKSNFNNLLVAKDSNKRRTAKVDLGSGFKYIDVQIPTGIGLDEEVREVAFVFDIDKVLTASGTVNIEEAVLQEIVKAFELMRKNKNLKIRFEFISGSPYKQYVVTQYGDKINDWPWDDLAKSVDMEGGALREKILNDLKAQGYSDLLNVRAVPFLKESVEQRVMNPIVKRLEQKGLLSEFGKNITIKTISGSEGAVFDEETSTYKYYSNKEGRIFEINEQLAMSKALAIGCLRYLHDSRNEDYDYFVTKIENAKDFAGDNGVDSIFKEAVKGLDISFWPFESEIVIVSHNIDLNGEQIAIEAFESIKKDVLSSEESNYFVSGGKSFAKISLFSKAQEVKASTETEVVLGAGDTIKTDDFLHSSEIKRGIWFYMGARSDIDNYPGVIASLDKNGNDYLLEKGAPILIGNVLDVMSENGVWWDVKALNLLYSFRELYKALPDAAMMSVNVEAKVTGDNSTSSDKAMILTGDVELAEAVDPQKILDDWNNWAMRSVRFAKNQWNVFISGIPESVQDSLLHNDRGEFYTMEQFDVRDLFDSDKRESFIKKLQQAFNGRKVILLHHFTETKDGQRETGESQIMKVATILRAQANTAGLKDLPHHVFVMSADLVDLSLFPVEDLGTSYMLFHNNFSYFVFDGSEIKTAGEPSAWSIRLGINKLKKRISNMKPGEQITLSLQQIRDSDFDELPFRIRYKILSESPQLESVGPGNWKKKQDPAMTAEEMIVHVLESIEPFLSKNSRIEPFFLSMRRFPSDWDLYSNLIRNKLNVMLEGKGDINNEISLHLGSANSFLPNAEALAGFNVITTDITESSFEQQRQIYQELITGENRKIGNHVFESLDILELSERFKPNTVDHVTMTNVFNSPDNDLAGDSLTILENIASIIKPGGTITMGGGVVYYIFENILEDAGIQFEKVDLGQGTESSSFYSYRIISKDNAVLTQQSGEDGSSLDVKITGADIDSFNKSITDPADSSNEITLAELVERQYGRPAAGMPAEEIKNLGHGVSILSAAQKKDNRNPETWLALQKLLDILKSTEAYKNGALFLSDIEEMVLHNTLLGGTAVSKEVYREEPRGQDEIDKIKTENGNKISDRNNRTWEADITGLITHNGRLVFEIAPVDPDGFKSLLSDFGKMPFSKIFLSGIGVFLRGLTPEELKDLSEKQEEIKKIHLGSITMSQPQLSLHSNDLQSGAALFSITDSSPAASPVGGIDLNARNLDMDISKDGRGVEMKFDPAMIAEFEGGNFTGVVPVIIRVTPLSNPLMLLGLDADTGAVQPVS
ncbi:MAG: class I SAM-dependent methyltransferase [Candidatus Omnitrophota bacterium]